MLLQTTASAKPSEEALIHIHLLAQNIVLKGSRKSLKIRDKGCQLHLPRSNYL